MGEPPSFKIKGKGEDNGKEFTLESDDFEITKEFLEDWSSIRFLKDGDDAYYNFDSFTFNRETK